MKRRKDAVTQELWWGHNQMAIICTFRYALGRKSYVSHEVAAWLIEHWERLTDFNKKLIVVEIKDALQQGNAGDPCDVMSWESVVDYDRGNADDKS